MALVVLISGFAWTYYAGPSPRAWYPPCPLRATTGLLCPGCGSARVVHDLVHGNLRAACGHNILVVVVAPFLAIWTARSLWRALRHNLPPLPVRTGLARVVLVVVVVFMIARNLPWWPFALLAPGP
ncbi:DUF2752 domain-containing protein [Ereboglobus sp. PH5-10]|uniref:DUF2752 domain-containing protein n=1 Tax=Ereboglobus sp. PH5-10 TaxID=2940629 RepID=UPI002404A51B|nr:DUF2752 domain-containing protein [Ereboglobus sp. PH5-10]